MNYAFSNLLGAPYRGGNLVIHDNQLFSPVGNRVSQVRGQVPQAVKLPLPGPAVTNKRKPAVALTPHGVWLMRAGRPDSVSKLNFAP